MGYYFEDYLHDNADNAANKGERRKTVEQAVKSIERWRQGIGGLDFIAVSGASGLSVGAVVAYELGLPCVIVRKPEEARNSHCGGQMVCPGYLHKDSGKYVIVDDFIGGGNTVKYIQRTLDRGTCVGFYGYAASDSDNAHKCRVNNLPVVPKV